VYNNFTACKKDVVKLSFGERLKRLREERDLTQLELAKILNIANSTLSLYESGKRHPDFETLQKIAKFFNVTTDFLLGRTDDPRGILDEPSELEIEDWLKNSKLMFEGEEVTEEMKEELIEYLKMRLRRERKKQREALKQQGKTE